MSTQESSQQNERHGKEAEAIAATRRALDDSVERIAPETRQALRSAREQALRVAERKTFWQQPFLPLASGLAMVMVIVLIWPGVEQDVIPDSQSASSPIADNQSLPLSQGQQGENLEDWLWVSELDNETFELVEEIEFAYWLSQAMSEESDMGVGHRG